MKTTQLLLQQFQNFAVARLGNGGADLSIDELFDEWRLQNPLPEEHQTNCKAVAASLRDFDNGQRGTPADEFMRDFRSRNDVQ